MSQQLSPLKTCLISVPPDNNRAAALFEELLIHIHEALHGQPIAFEILATGHSIAFCFSARQETAEILAGQIYALFPECYIQEIADFTRHLGAGVQFVSTESRLARSDLLPLKDRAEGDGDSLAVVLSTLTKCAPGETLLVQLVLRPRGHNTLHQLRLNLRRGLEKVRRTFRLRNWVKKGLSQTQDEKIADKTRQPLFAANLRLASYSVTTDVDPAVHLHDLVNTYASFGASDTNEIRFGRIRRLIDLRLFQNRELKRAFLLTPAEVAGLFHLPSEKEAPNIVHVISRKEPPPATLPTNTDDPEIAFFGITNYRGRRMPFGIRHGDRDRHVYVLGKSGTGKSKLLEMLIRNDIDNGRGVTVLDSSGALVDELLTHIPPPRVKDVVLFDPLDLEYPPSFNPFDEVPEPLKPGLLVLDVEAWKKLLSPAWCPQLEHLVRYTLLALMDIPGATVLSIIKLLSDPEYRESAAAHILDLSVRNFWLRVFPVWSTHYDQEAVAPLFNKAGQIAASNVLANILGQPRNLFPLDEAIAYRKIVLLKVPSTALGAENALLLGNLLLSRIFHSASGIRASVGRKPSCACYIDGVESFALPGFAQILTEGQNAGLQFTLAHQHLAQLDPEAGKAILGNCGSIIAFRLGAEDAAVIAKELSPRFTDRDLMNLGMREFCVKMLINGEVNEAFSGRTMNTTAAELHSREECIKLSRAYYCRPAKEAVRLVEESDFVLREASAVKQAIILNASEDGD